MRENRKCSNVCICWSSGNAVSPHKCYANCCSHSLSHCIRRQPCRTHTHITYVHICICIIFHNRNFFCCCFCCAHSHAYIRSTHTEPQVWLCLPAALSCFGRRRLRFTQCCVVLLSLHLLCATYSRSVSYILRCTRTRAHMYMYAYTDTHTHRHRPENVYEKATTEKQRRRRRLRCDCEHTAVLLYFFFFVSLPLCVSCVQTRFVVELRKKSEKPLCEINI